MKKSFVSWKESKTFLWDVFQNESGTVWNLKPFLVVFCESPTDWSIGRSISRSIGAIDLSESQCFSFNLWRSHFALCSGSFSVARTEPSWTWRENPRFSPDLSEQGQGGVRPHSAACWHAVVLQHFGDVSFKFSFWRQGNRVRMSPAGAPGTSGGAALRPVRLAAAHASNCKLLNVVNTSESSGILGNAAPKRKNHWGSKSGFSFLNQSSGPVRNRRFPLSLWLQVESWTDLKGLDSGRFTSATAASFTFSRISSIRVNFRFSTRVTEDILSTWLVPAGTF